MGRDLEELGRMESRWEWPTSWLRNQGPLWDEGIELRDVLSGSGRELRLFQGGCEVGRLRAEDRAPVIEAESAWAELLLRAMFEGRHREREASCWPLAA